jgi:Protein of unknown function (DUF1579)
MRHWRIFAAAICGTLAFASAAWPQAAGDDRKILDNMAKLKPMIGRWRAAIDYHNRDGSVELRGGDYDIRPVLRDTYLQLDADIYRLNDRAKHHGFIMMTTYNPDTKKFDGTYFYTLWAMRVTEAGVFDDARQELAVDTFVPKEDGVHDETVHAVWKFNRNGTIEYWHWSRYDNEKAPLMNLHALLTRVKA